MNFKLLILVLDLIILHSQCESEDEDACVLFEKFKIKYNKKYESESEENFRFEQFKKNLKKLRRQNELEENGMPSFSEGMDKSSDRVRFL